MHCVQLHILATLAVIRIIIIYIAMVYTFNSFKSCMMLHECLHSINLVVTN